LAGLLYSSFILTHEEPLPLTYRLVDRAASPSRGYSDAPPYVTALLIPTLPFLNPALPCASSGPANVRLDGGPGLSLAHLHAFARAEIPLALVEDIVAY